MIARAANTSESQLVKHFGSKDGLLEAIFEQGWQSMAESFAAAMHAPSPADRLRLLIQNALAGLERDPELKELMLFEARRIRKRGNLVLITRSFLDLVSRAEGLLTQMHEEGALRPGVNPQAAASALVGVCEGILRDQLLSRRQGVERSHTMEDVNTILGLVLSAFLVPERASRAGSGS
jgi:AcrR family transcriptional regulator